MSTRRKKTISNKSDETEENIKMKNSNITEEGNKKKRGRPPSSSSSSSSNSTTSSPTTTTTTAKSKTQPGSKRHKNGYGPKSTELPIPEEIIDEKNSNNDSSDDGDDENIASGKSSLSEFKQPIGTSAASSNKRSRPITIQTNNEKSPVKPNSSTMAGTSDLIRSPSRKRRNTNSSVDEMSDDGCDNELTIYTSIQQALGKHYFNVMERLQLHFRPSCLSDLKYCAKFHTKHGDQSQTNEIDHYLVQDARNLILEDRPQDFVKFVSKMSISNDFPGKIIILTLLELILTVNKPSHDHYTTNFIIETANHLFENVITNFPPCWCDVRESYKILLNQKLHINLSKKYDVNSGIVKVVLDMLETVLQEEYVYSDSGDEIASSSELLTPTMFREWDKTQSQKYLFDNIPRDDKIERIFIVLHLLVKLMESDLALWIIRHPKNTSNTMSKPKKMPLIGFLLWPAEERGQINQLIKKILNLFVICISIGFPVNKIDVLARFVNLISHAINLCELQKNGEIRFPHIQSQTEVFAQEVKKTITNVQAGNVDLILSVIDHIKAPFIKIIVIDQLLMQFNRDVGKPSMKKLYQNFVKKRWQECDEDGSRKVFLYIPTDQKSSKYPIYRPLTKSAKLTDIYQKDYLDLLMASFKSYQNLYQISTIVRNDDKKKLLFISENLTSPTKSGTMITGGNSGGGGQINNEQQQQQSSGSMQMMTSDEYEQALKKLEIQKEEKKFNFNEMEKDIGKLKTIAMKSATMNSIYYSDNEYTMDDISIDSATVLRYREDIKFYLTLCELIENYYHEYGEIFSDWLDAIKTA